MTLVEPRFFEFEERLGAFEHAMAITINAANSALFLSPSQKRRLLAVRKCKTAFAEAIKLGDQPTNESDFDPETMMRPPDDWSWSEGAW
ncbi:MAG: hypothetical protein D5R96_07700 [Methanocalculus sp. MSAO_Arc2]|uniref:hypothetical protein n=1 Tax=Methanocalculus sp. MSAO_Arc2 TaxID=2293855 RepID=UPI000FEE06AF|nr:MAG: hypothetical protein D5R96_07700 [Methanocalculus sp. MSAO_Arc2]